MLFGVSGLLLLLLLLIASWLARIMHLTLLRYQLGVMGQQGGRTILHTVYTYWGPVPAW